MNMLASELATVCRDHLLSEKWLISPSRRIGLRQAGLSLWNES